jgi:septal ring factor EnvC (AmiA/AmiB activator)
MKCANKALLVIGVVSSLGLWGCTQNSGNHSARLRDLESRHAKLEEDHRNTVVARDQARKRLASVEEQRAKVNQQIEATIKERDDLSKQILARVGERDAIQAQLIQFGKELQNLAGKVEAAAQSYGPPLTTSAPETAVITKEAKAD